MKPADIHRLAANEWRAPSLPWWYQYASDAAAAGRMWLIHRHDSAVYLARFWLSEPVLKPAADGDCPFDVANSAMLHLFLQPDDDAALHDHPCGFTTTILEGAYVEARPAPTWDRATGLGPVPHSNIVAWPTGSVLRRRATDLHAVVGLNTRTVWTLVRNGPRERPWGFWPEGAAWVDAKEYFARTA